MAVIDLTKLPMLLLVIMSYQASGRPRIVNLRGKPDFRKVMLNWELLDPEGEAVTGLFRVKYCENQVWGEHLCRSKVIQQKPTKKQFSTEILGRRRAG